MLKVIKNNLIFIIVLSDNIFRAFINKDNEYIKELMRKIFYIYSKQLKRKKLYYFMKLVYITTFLKKKNNKLKNNLNNSNFNKLYNDYISRNKKKSNMKIEYLRNESELYPYSPNLNNKGYFTFSPRNSKRNYHMPIFNNLGKTSYDKGSVPMNVKYNSFFNKNYKNGRNNMIDGSEFVNITDRYNYKIFNENDKNNDFIQKGFYGNKNPINLKESSYKFANNKKLISSRLNKNINKQISEYLNNFENAKIQNYLNNNYLNYERNSNKYHSKKPNLTFDKERFYSNNKNNSKRNLFNKNNKKEIGYNDKTERFSFIKDNKSKSLFKLYSDKKIENRNKKNNKIIYNDSQNYLNNLTKKNELNNKEKNKSSKNSLNPSSVGADQTKTFYTTHHRHSYNNIKSTNGLLSNINSISSRMNEPNTHFLTGLKMISGVNECFYDFNHKDNNNKNNIHRDELSMQILSDSKMMELASKYITEDDNSSENYQMNNILYNKKKYKNKRQ